MPEFSYAGPLPAGPDQTDYRRLDVTRVSERGAFGRKFTADDKRNDFLAGLGGPLLAIGSR